MEKILEQASSPSGSRGKKHLIRDAVLRSRVLKEVFVDKKPYVLAAALGIVGGFMGGLLSARLNTLVRRGPAPAALIESKPAGVIQAEEFRLVSREGATRGVFSVADGKPHLLLYDKAGKTRMDLSLSDAHEIDNQPYGTISFAEGEPSLGLYDKAGREHIGLSVDDGHPVVSLDGPGPGGVPGIGLPRFSLDVDRDGPVLALYGRGGRLSLESRPTPGLSLIDTKNRARAGLELSASGAPSVALWDGEGHLRANIGSIGLTYPRTGSTTNEAESTVVLFGSDGKSIWKVP